MGVRRLRLGEIAALGGSISVIVALSTCWYETPHGNLNAWSSFGPAVVLLILAGIAGLALALATVSERSTALPVAAAIWGTLFGLLAVIGALVRVLERPQGATALCAGAWAGLAGAVAILGGSWQSLRDERKQLYPPAHVEPRPAPPTAP